MQVMSYCQNSILNTEVGLIHGAGYEGKIVVVIRVNTRGRLIHGPVVHTRRNAVPMQQSFFPGFLSSLGSTGNLPYSANFDFHPKN